jgi:hypothetical protein
MTGILLELFENNLQTINKIVDLTLARENSAGQIIIDGYPDPALDMFMPLVNYPDAHLAIMKMKTFAPTLARIGATDGEVRPERSKVTLDVERLGNLKIYKSRLLTEEDANTLQRAKVLDILGSPQAAQAIRDMYLSTPALLAQSCINLATVLALRVAISGACLYTDPVTDIAAELSYASSIPSGHIAATKTGNARWSQLATANGIQDLLDHMNVYYNTLRRFPPYVIMGRTEALNLVSQASTKEQVARLKGMLTEAGTVDAAAIANMPQPTLDDVAGVISNRLMGTSGRSGTTQLIVSDAIYYNSDESGNPTTTAPYIPAGYYLFATPGYMERAIVPSAENNYLGGLITVPEAVSKVPMRDKLTVVGRMVPLVADPRLLAARNVENSAIS